MRFLVLEGAPISVAVELAQEAMTALWRSWATVESPASWVRTVASRAWIRYRVHVPEQPMATLPEPSVLLNSSADSDIFLEQQDVRRLLDLLPQRQRHVMALSLDGFQQEEIAKKLGITSSSVRTHIQLARRSLLAALRDEEWADTGSESAGKGLIDGAETALSQASSSLLQLLEVLPPRQRQIMARTYDGDAPAEIAAELGITEATVRSSLRHARQAMARNASPRMGGQR